MPVVSTPSSTEAVLARTVGGTGPGLVLAHGAGGSVALNYGPILDGLGPGTPSSASTTRAPAARRAPPAG